MKVEAVTLRVPRALSALSMAPARAATLPTNARSRHHETAIATGVAVVDGAAVAVDGAIARERRGRNDHTAMAVHIGVGDSAAIVVLSIIAQERRPRHDEGTGAGDVSVIDCSSIGVGVVVQERRARHAYEAPMNVLDCPAEPGERWCCRHVG